MRKTLHVGSGIVGTWHPLMPYICLMHCLLHAVRTILILQSVAMAAPLPRRTPESQGIRSQELRAVFAALHEIDAIHSCLIVRHGYVVAEAWWAPFEPHAPHKLYSLSKSFTSTAVGMAVAEGKLSLDDPVMAFFPDKVPESPSNHLKNMRVRDLLAMSTGHVSEDLSAFSFRAESNLVDDFLALPVKHKPGTHFLYNTPATYLCAAIVEKVTSESLVDYLGPRLFDPLGMGTPSWETCPQGIALGGYGLSVRTEDIAKLGQLYLQGGEWQGKRLLSRAWTRAATARQTSNGSHPESDWDQGYGYQFWRCRHGAYRGDGAFGQFCIVLPEQETVVAITSGTGRMQGVMNVLWEKLLPALRPAPLPENVREHEALSNDLQRLALPLPKGEDLPAMPKGDYHVDENPYGLEAVQFVENALQFTVHGDTHIVAYTHGAWHASQTGFGPTLIDRGLARAREPIAASAAWSEGTLTVKIWYVETPYALTLTCQWNGDDERQLTLSGEWNVAFGDRVLKPLAARLK